MHTILCLFAYLLGAIPFGLILAQKFKSVDLRTIGSGNIGATNARRAGGWRLGVATLLCDMAKGAVPVGLMGTLVGGESTGMAEVWMGAAAICAVSGHLFPIYLGFKTGGKGVSTAAGCFAVISPPAMAMSLMVFLAAALFSNRVSVGSIAAAAVLPFGVFWATRSLVLTGCALVVAGMVISRHRDNIKRLREGREPMIRERKHRL